MHIKLWSLLLGVQLSVTILGGMLVQVHAHVLYVQAFVPSLICNELGLLMHLFRPFSSCLSISISFKSTTTSMGL